MPPRNLGYCGLRKARSFSTAGFTLIEVLVAMTIFSIAVLGLAMGATSVMRANQTSYYATIATNLAQDKLEQLKATATANIETCEPPDPPCDNPVPTYSGVEYTRTWTAQSNFPVNGVMQINVTVRWRDYTDRTLVVSSAVKM